MIRRVCLFLAMGLPLSARAGEAYVAASEVASAVATQAVAVDRDFAYAVGSRSIAKIDRGTGKEIARSEGRAHHLNSAVFHGGAIYCAHSNFPLKPEEGDIRKLDPETMKLEIFHVFGRPPGSLTWALPDKDGWWCHFARYGKDKGKSVLVRYDGDWKETGRWLYPEALVRKWGGSSLSGAVMKDGFLLATGHDAREIYKLKVNADAIGWVDTLASPFPGQGIALDPLTGGLAGIDRKRKAVVFAVLEKP